MQQREHSVTPKPGCYLVTGRDGINKVTKSKTCSCGCEGKPYCPHILAVAAHLRAGGEQAPEHHPTTGLLPATVAALSSAPMRVGMVAEWRATYRPEDGRHRFWFVPEACPICGGPVERDRSMDGPRGPGWRCSGGYEHLFQLRYGHLKPWLARNAPGEPVTKPQVVTIGVRCYEVQIPTGDGYAVHIVGGDGRGAVCYTCNSAHCEAIPHIEPIPVELPEPAVAVQRSKS